MKPASDLRYRALSSAKLAFYGAHYALSRAMSAPFDRPGEVPFTSEKPLPKTGELREAFKSAFQQDQDNIARGLYCAPDPRAEWAVSKNSFAYLQDVRTLDRRRVERKATEVRQETESAGFPAYYRQNFHWQTGGWLTEESAELYDFQVETIFTGSAGAMRRATALALLAESLKGQDQRALACAEIACGTGGFAREIMRNFPRLSLSALDMSPAYTKKTATLLRRFRRAQAINAAAEALPFPDASLDRCVCIYLFHELPPKVRKQVVAEMARVTKRGGVVILADALQESDDPNLDRLLEAFPVGFHEPFFGSWLTADIEALFAETGFVVQDKRRAFLTKAWAFKRV